MEVFVHHEERYWYPDDGGIVWVAGYQPVDPDSGRFLSREELHERGLVSCGIAGAAQHHADTLAAIELGAPLELRRDAANEHDSNAIAVFSGEGRQAGWVPREIAATLAPRLDAGEAWSAVALRERRASPRDPRTGMTMLLAPGAIELRDHVH
jgi:HIRAN domain-containing protein